MSLMCRLVDLTRGLSCGVVLTPWLQRHAERCAYCRAESAAYDALAEALRDTNENEALCSLKWPQITAALENSASRARRGGAILRPAMAAGSLAVIFAAAFSLWQSTPFEPWQPERYPERYVDFRVPDAAGIPAPLSAPAASTVVSGQKSPGQKMIADARPDVPVRRVRHTPRRKPGPPRQHIAKIVPDPPSTSAEDDDAASEVAASAQAPRVEEPSAGRKPRVVVTGALEHVIEFVPVTTEAVNTSYVIGKVTDDADNARGTLL